MKEHGNESVSTTPGFENPRKEKMCRYFRNGFCLKGIQCAFKHSNVEKHQVPTCKRGQYCLYNDQNRCKFFHPVVGSTNSQQTQKRECRYSIN